jgi:hypothetical protein
LTSEDPDIAGAKTIDDPRHEKVVRFVDYLASKGIRLQYHEENREWRVTSQTFGAYAAKVESIRAFPDGTTLREMQAGCLMINLAHGLNPKAQLIMSVPGLSYIGDGNSPLDNTSTVDVHGQKTTEILSHPEYIKLERKLKQLFIEYEP